jgi:hypothetical protein
MYGESDLGRLWIPFVSEKFGLTLWNASDCLVYNNSMRLNDIPLVGGEAAYMCRVVANKANEGTDVDRADGLLVEGLRHNGGNCVQPSCDPFKGQQFQSTPPRGKRFKNSFDN